MEKLIKENEGLFIEYLGMKEKYEREKRELNDRIRKIKSEIVSRNLALDEIIGDTDPYKIIEENKSKIIQLKTEMAEIGVRKNVEDIKEKRTKNKLMQDYDNDIINKKIENIQNENDKILEICKQKPISAQELKDMENSREEIKRLNVNYEEKKKEVQSLIQRKIEEVEEKLKIKNEVLRKIEDKRSEIVENLKSEINDREEVIESISTKEYDIADFNEIKENTIKRLKEEIEQLPYKANEEIEELRSIKDENEKEKSKLVVQIEEYRYLYTCIENGNAKNVIYKSLNIEEKVNEEIKEENKVVEESKPEEFRYPEVRKWAKDRNGNNILVSVKEYEKNDYTQTVLNKISRFFKKISHKIINLKNKITSKKVDKNEEINTKNEEKNNFQSDLKFDGNIEINTNTIFEDRISKVKTKEEIQKN